MEPTIRIVDLKNCKQIQAQGFNRIPIFNLENTGGKHLSLECVILPKGAEATPHAHIGVHTVVYTLKGSVRIFYGEKLESQVVVKPEGCVYIPPDIIHYVVNEQDEDMIAIVARTPFEHQVQEYTHLLNQLPSNYHF